MKNVDDKYLIALSNHVKNILETKNINIADLAAAANLDRRQIYRLINKENIPKLSTLVRIALAAGIEHKQLHDFEFDFESYMRQNNILMVQSKQNSL